MGAPQEVLQEIFTVIEGGREVGTSAEIIQFPSDNGANTFNIVQRTIRGANGTGMNYWVSAVASGASALSAGALVITCTFPEFIALAVPCLGIAVGTIWYNMAPEFWDGVAEKLVNAGYTINGKIVAYMNTEGNLTFPEGAVKILADDLIDANVFNLGEDVLPEERQTELFWPDNYSDVNIQSGIMTNQSYFDQNYSEVQYSFQYVSGSRTIKTGVMLKYDTVNLRYSLVPIAFSEAPFTVTFTRLRPWTETVNLVGSPFSRNDITYYIARPNWGASFSARGSMSSYAYVDNGDLTSNWDQYLWDIAHISFTGERVDGNEDVLQEGATYPEKNISWRDLFPHWIPWEFPLIPVTGGDPFQLPPGLPVEYPNNLPIEQPYQLPAQDPGNNVEDNPDDVEETITDPRHDPRQNEATGEDTGEDPDDSTEDEVIPSDPPGEQEDPIDPDPPIPPSPIIPVPLPPATVSSNKLFTVYNPTSSQLDQLGGYLWDNSLIETLKKIWQNPLDGIIGLSQVYCTPATGGSHNIILGYLDSGVPSAVVTDQFSHIDCGEVEIPEINENATDYNPYTAIQIYLPFIGITELDVNEFMGGRIGVKYHIDVYTGTCLAEVKMRRSRDVPNSSIVYTFSGNCSQQLPLTSGDQKGLLSALIGAAGVGLGIASGGMTAAASAGMALGEVRRDVSREMMHVSHSGNLSANAGIMGQKKPYVIINRQKPYNANSYGKFYGYPVNKTVFLSNFTGFCRVKAARLRSRATEEEKKEIMELCQEGIIM